MRSETSYVLRDLCRFCSGMCGLTGLVALGTGQPLWACGAAANGVLFLLLSIAPPVRPPERVVDPDD